LARGEKPQKTPLVASKGKGRFHEKMWQKKKRNGIIPLHAPRARTTWPRGRGLNFVFFFGAARNRGRNERKDPASASKWERPAGPPHGQSKGYRPRTRFSFFKHFDHAHPSGARTCGAEETQQHKRERNDSGRNPPWGRKNTREQEIAGQRSHFSGRRKRNQDV